VQKPSPRKTLPAARVEHKYDRKCPECHEDFVTDHVLRIYCSPGCASPPRFCIVCARSFQPPPERRTQVYCTFACSAYRRPVVPKRISFQGIGGFVSPDRRTSRVCVSCKGQFKPQGSAQKYCKTCAPDRAAYNRLRLYGDSAHRYVSPGGRKQATCRRCNLVFEYEYRGGGTRACCDTCQATMVAIGTTVGARTRPPTLCVECGTRSNFLDEDGRCRRHEQSKKRTVHDCDGCGKQFETWLAQPRRYCSDKCRKGRRPHFAAERVCTLCQEPFTANHPRLRWCHRCVEVREDRRRAGRYGLSYPQFERLKARFAGMCWLCRSKLGECVDHDHATDRVRGWLCRTCNMALHFVERPGWWAAASAYLEGGDE
jgi:hypothetical protein